MAIIEQRTYRIKVGMVQDYLRFYHNEAFEIHCRYLGPSIGWFYTDYRYCYSNIRSNRSCISISIRRFIIYESG